MEDPVNIHHLHFQFYVKIARPDVLPMEGLFSDSLCLFWYDLFPIRYRLAQGSDWQILKSAYGRILDTALPLSSPCHRLPGHCVVVNNGVFSVYRLSPSQHPDP